jgi:hypothetical protein
MSSRTPSTIVLFEKEKHYGRHNGKTACSITPSLRVGTSCSTHAKAKAFFALSMTWDCMETGAQSVSPHSRAKKHRSTSAAQFKNKLLANGGVGGQHI